MAIIRPQTLEEALAVARDVQPRILAGGTDYFPALSPEKIGGAVMDVSHIKGLRGIEWRPDGWTIGAATTWADIAKADLPAAFDGLTSAARQVGSEQIQNKATIAGNICNASPAADGVPPLMALQAQVEIGAATARRFVSLDQFITGPRQTVLAPGEMVVALHLPPIAEGEVSAFVKLGSRAYLVISIAMVAVNLVLKADRISALRIVVGACAPTAQRMVGLEAKWLGLRLDEVAQIAVEPVDLSPLSPLDDVRASADYRLHAAGVLCKRAVLMAGSGTAGRGVSYV